MCVTGLRSQVLNSRGQGGLHYVRRLDVRSCLGRTEANGESVLDLAVLAISRPFSKATGGTDPYAGGLWLAKWINLEL